MNQQPTRKIVIAHYRPDIVSGAENSIADLIEQIDPRFQVTMLVPAGGNLANFFRKRGFQVWVKHIETPRRLFPGLHTLQSRLLASEFRKREVDAVLCNTFPAASRVSTACRMAGVPFAIYMRDYLVDTPINRLLLQQTEMLFAISRDVIRQHSAMTDPARFRLTYNFIKPDPILDRYEAHLASGRRLVPFDSSHPVIGLVGRITPYKQPDLFIRAIPTVLEQAPEARFVLVGAAQEREKEYEISLHRLADSLGIGNRLEFLGQRNDAVELTSEFTVACLASGREPLGRVILEANLLGVPVIVPDTGGPAEIIENEVTGLHFSSSSPDSSGRLAQQIIRLLKNPELRDCLVDKARDRILHTFASHRHVEIQEELIDQLCSTARQ